MLFDSAPDVALQIVPHHMTWCLNARLHCLKGAVKCATFLSFLKVNNYHNAFI